MVFVFGPLAQAYGMCLFTLAAGVPDFRARRRSKWIALAAAAGRASSPEPRPRSSLLSAAAAPVLLVWMFVLQSRGQPME